MPARVNYEDSREPCNETKYKKKRQKCDHGRNNKLQAQIGNEPASLTRQRKFFSKRREAEEIENRDEVKGRRMKSGRWD